MSGQPSSYKLISEVDLSIYEREMSRLIDLGYEPMGELSVAPYSEVRFNGGCNMWERVSGLRYTREMKLSPNGFSGNCGDEYERPATTP